MPAIRTALASLLALASVCCADDAAPAGQWSGFARMGETREYPGLAILPGGKILAVTGHPLGGKSLASAEIYDPQTDSWSDTASMHVPRNGVSPKGLIVLPSGKILIAGGGSGRRSVHEVELYDPSSKTWELTEPMSAPRCVHTTTQLASGDVLVTGGIDWLTNEVRRTAEVYDHQTGRWSSAGTMHTPRFGHSAVRLTDGRVLVMGGHNDYPGFEPVVADAEIYDPASGEWRQVPPMHTARRSFRAVLLEDGRVLVVAGASGSRNAARQLADCEIYDPDANQWHRTAPLKQARWGPTVDLLSDGSVLITGGGIGPFGARGSAERFDPKTETWSPAGELNQPRNGHRSITLPDGRILIAGGHYVGTYLNSCEVYTP